MKEIPLSQGKVALVDDEDYERVSQFKWCAYKPASSKTFYACRWVVMNGKKTTMQMHRFILGGDGGVDHRDHDGLNNQRCNLRASIPSLNSSNRRIQANSKTGYKGVFPSGAKRFIARIVVGGKRIHLGAYGSARQAAAAYDLAAVQYLGEWACLNLSDAVT